MEKLGVRLPRTSEEQYASGQEVAYEDAMPGDLLFYDSLHKGTVSHVALYLGNGSIVHANGDTVRFEKVENMNKLYPFYGVKRYLAVK
jgi:peptidoglycan endopeptidase LytE